MDDATDEEKYLLDMIAHINQEHQKTLKPYMDRLVSIKSIAPMRPIFIDKDCFISEDGVRIMPYHDLP